jgi:F-type H+-transporting ATPase subunit alpha
VAEVGKVLEVGDGVAQIYGLSKAMAGEMLEFADGAVGVVFNLEENSVGAVVLGDYLGIKEGDEVRTTGKLLSVPVGEAMIGRVVDPLGRPLDGKGPIQTPHRRPLESDRAGHRRASAGEPAATDRHQGDRRDDPDRPRVSVS